ncbi:MAG TPA: universal stress protein [Gemmatimonadales bacterium]|nr:universal stress protein [Gemmatimonadales bacterium]
MARLVDPGVENRAAGATGAGVGLALRHDVEQLLHERLLARSSDLLGGRPARVVIRGALGRVDRPLTGVAEENAADLLVVGSHQRAGFRRWWHGSVSSGVLHGALANVVVVPWRGEGEGA